MSQDNIPAENMTGRLQCAVSSMTSTGTEAVQSYINFDLSPPIPPKIPNILYATVKTKLTGISSSCTVNVAGQVDLGEENDTGSLPYL
jgi:hypothetical protein